MIFIAHRGCTLGPSNYENHPDFIKSALSLNFDVEIDVWFIDNKYILGHDKPDYEVNTSFLEKPHLWCHAKNIEAITSISANPKIHSFFHDKDDVALTSRRYIWTYPGKSILNSNAIAVLPERVSNWDISLSGGICSDYIEEYRRKYAK